MNAGQAADAAKPALAEAEQARRAAELERRQQTFIQSILTSRSLPKRQSTIAGGSGITNELFRKGEEVEALRQAKLVAEAKEQQERVETSAELQAQKHKLAEKVDKKRMQRQKKKRRLEQNHQDRQREPRVSNDDCSDDETDSDT